MKSMKRFLAMLVLATAACRGDERQPSSGLPTCAPDQIDLLPAYCAGKWKNQDGERFDPCSLYPAEYAEACAAGCFLKMCGDLACDHTPSTCGAACDSPKSGEFWARLLSADTVCRYQRRLKQPELAACIISETEAQCPGLAGTRWSEGLPEIKRDGRRTVD
jgi:hypothetical protein